MKGTELIPATEEESRAVTVEPVGTGLAPTVQVSLAKRIIHPRTNKVVCLAAQTEVPMEEDELASVSDLALRLSDGTNVRLSMSFFNDELVPANFMPGMARRTVRPEPPIYTYDPDRYETHRAPDQSWRLMLVFGGICAVTLGSFFYFVPGGFERAAAKIIAAIPPAAVPLATSLPSLQKPQTTKPSLNATTSGAPTKAKIANQKTRNQKTQPSKSPSPKRASRKTSRNHEQFVEQFSENAPPKAPHGARASRTVLVPPPPPTMAFPLNQMQMFGYSPYAVPGLAAPVMSPPDIKPASAKPKTAPSAAGKQPTSDNPTTSTEAKSPATLEPKPPAASEPKPNKLLQSVFLLQEAAARTPARSNQQSTQQPSMHQPAASHQTTSRNIFTDNDSPAVSSQSTSSTPAPSPGGGEPLERIVVP